MRTGDGGLGKGGEGGGDEDSRGTYEGVGEVRLN